MHTEEIALMYREMIKLTETTEAFYFKDYDVGDYVYRAFNYRLASYTEFCLPYSLDMRGITFMLVEGGDPILISRPFKKFFNYRENPYTDEKAVNLAEADWYEEKADGSLICTWFNPISNEVGLKSAQNLYSEQAIAADEFIKYHSNLQFRNSIESLAREGYTVLMELCSPFNRIVLPYASTQLKIHGIIHTASGIEITPDNEKVNECLRTKWVDRVKVKGLTEAFITNTLTKKDIEGYVVHGPWGRFKIKTSWYCNLHKLKESVETTKSLIEAILYDRVDDVKSLLVGDSYVMDKIFRVESVVVTYYNHMIKTVSEFVFLNRTMLRKDFALKAKEELGLWFHLGMQEYLNKEPDYKDFIMKYHKELFNLGDTP